MTIVPRLITVTSDHMPPSVNNLFATVAGGKRIRSKRYNEWANAAGWDCNGKGSIPGPFELHLILSRKHRRKGQDLDNLIKAPMDLFVAHGLVEGDHLCERVSAEYGDCTGFYAEIRPYSCRYDQKPNDKQAPNSELVRS